MPGQAQSVQELHRFTLDDLYIRTKDKRIVKFVPNDVQERYLDEIAPNWQDGDYKLHGVQEIILKARQFGFSTLIAALFFLDTINNPGTGTVVISNDQKNTKKLFQMVDRFYRHLPESLRPRTQRANTDELYWPDIDCHYEVMTAGSKTSGRGWTINNLHCSEVAFWEDPEVFGGLLDAVPAGGNVFLESTANGEGSEQQDEDGEMVTTGSAFHVYFEKADEGRSPYEARFFPWFLHDEYRQTAPDDFTPTTEETEKADPFQFARYGNETRYAELYGLDYDQLFWRRQMIEKPGKGPAMFAQEYPANKVEAFRTSGKKFFAGFWNPDIHVLDVEIQPWWIPAGGYDWGIAVPYGYLQGWFYPLPSGNGVGCHVSDELYGARIRNTDQAKNILDLFKARHLSKDDVYILADPATWAKQGAHQADNIGRANIEDFFDVGLRMVKGNNNREHGAANMREYMVAEGALTVSPRCVNLIRQINQVKHDPHDLEVYEKSETADQHLVDCLRYLLNSRPRKAEPPPRQRTPEEITAEANRKFREQQLAERDELITGSYDSFGHDGDVPDGF